MCGRFSQQTSPAELARIFDAEVRADDPGARYNVAPTQPVLAVVQREDGRVIEQHCWGLVPSWAKSAARAGERINARVESVTSSPSFRVAFRRRRCLIPADGFYEWRREGTRRQPYLIRARDGSPLVFAGLWSPWLDRDSGGWLVSCAIVTGPPNDLVATLHDRMPVILRADAWAEWLDPQMTDAGALMRLLDPVPAAMLESFAVSTLVNDVRNEGQELLRPAAPLSSGSVSLWDGVM